MGDPAVTLKVTVHPQPGDTFMAHVFALQDGSTAQRHQAFQVGVQPVTVGIGGLRVGRSVVILLVPEDGAVLPAVRHLGPLAADRSIEFWPEVAAPQAGCVRTRDGRPSPGRVVRVLRRLPGAEPLDWVRVAGQLEGEVSSRLVHAYSWATTAGQSGDSRTEYDFSTATHVAYAVTDKEGRFEILGGGVSSVTVQLLEQIDHTSFSRRIAARVVHEARPIPGERLVLESP